MTLQDIYTLMEKFEQSELSELSIELGDAKVAFSKAKPAPVPMPFLPQMAAPMPAAPTAPAATPAEAPVPAGSFIKAPLVGTFYVAPAPGEAPFVTPGKQVKKGETVCLIEAMKMINEVPAPCDCIIEQVCLEDGEAVAFDTALFAIKEL